MKFSGFYLCFHNSREIWHLFSRTPLRNFLWCYYRWLLTSLGHEKCIKECNILHIHLFWYKDFVHWKLKLLNFLMDCGLQTQWIPYSRYRIPVFLSVELGDRSLFIAPGEGGGGFDFGGDRLIFTRTKGEIIRNWEPKRRITENFGRIQRVDRSNLLGKWRHGVGGSRKSSYIIDIIGGGGITSVK